jgi:hypothetical protein
VSPLQHGSAGQSGTISLEAPMTGASNPKLASALELAALGLRVHPLHDTENGQCSCGQPDCDRSGKHPRVGEWPRYATTGEAQIRRWWTLFPSANIGVATGPGSDLVGLDVDPRHNGDQTLAEFEREFGPLPATPTVITATGGRHFWFKHPGGRVPNSAGALGLGLDIRGDAGYLVAPGSTRDGVTYQFAPGLSASEVARQPLPEWLLCRILDGGRRFPAEQPVSGDLPDTASILSGVPHGQRDGHIFRFACRLRQAGVPIDFAEQLVLEAAARCFDPATGQPDPFDPETARAKVRQAYRRYEVGQSRGRSTRPDEARPAAPTLISASELLMRVIPPTRWVIDGLIPEGVTIMAGKPKVGKSWMGLDIGLGVATPCPVLGMAEAPEAGDVLYLALEDNERRLQSRMWKILGNGPVPPVTDAEPDMFAVDTPPIPARLTLATSWPRIDQQDENGRTGLDHIRAWAESVPDARLVLIDTLAKVRPTPRRDQGVYAADYDAIVPLQQLASELRIAIILVTHLRKMASDDPNDEVSGSLGLTGAADGTLVLRRQRGRADAELHITGRDVEERQLALTFDPARARWSIVGDAESFRRTREESEIIAALRSIGHPAKPAQVAELIDASRETVRKRMSRMASRGVLTVRDGAYWPAPGQEGSGSPPHAGARAPAGGGVSHMSGCPGVRDIPDTCDTRDTPDRTDTPDHPDTHHPHTRPVAERGEVSGDPFAPRPGRSR